MQRRQRCLVTLFMRVMMNGQGVSLTSATCTASSLTGNKFASCRIAELSQVLRITHQRGQRPKASTCRTERRVFPSREKNRTGPHLDAREMTGLSHFIGAVSRVKRVRGVIMGVMPAPPMAAPPQPRAVKVLCRDKKR